MIEKLDFSESYYCFKYGGSDTSRDIAGICSSQRKRFGLIENLYSLGS